MSYIQAILYGFVQGVAEYLPISSSAHLILLPKFLGEADPGLAFDVFLHLGTLVATLIFFWKKWIVLIKNSLKNPFDTQGISLFHLGVATFPALIMGYLFHHWIQNELRAVLYIALGLSLGGVALYVCDRFFKIHRKLDQLKTIDYLKLGFFECLSLIPGMSRSGSTMMGGRVLGLSRQEAAECSFMMSAPVTLAAIVYECKGLVLADTSKLGSPDILVISGLSSFLFGILTIGFLLKLLNKIGFLQFMVYRVALAILILILF